MATVMTDTRARIHWLRLSLAALLGGLVGGLVGIIWLSPRVLIPIGVVIGLAVGQAAQRRR